MHDEIITDSDYRTISDAIQGGQNIKRKAYLNRDELNTCLISHTLKEIEKIIDVEKREPTISEMMDIAAGIKEDLSLSNGGYGLKVYKSIMSREMKFAEKMFGKKDKTMEIE